MVAMTIATMTICGKSEPEKRQRERGIRTRRHDADGMRDDEHEDTRGPGCGLTSTMASRVIQDERQEQEQEKQAIKKSRTL